MTSVKKCFFLFIAAAWCGLAPVCAMMTSISPANDVLAIDLPEGFQVIDAGEDGMSFQLQSTVAPVNAIIRLYDADSYADPAGALTDVLGKFKAQTDIDSFRWRHQDAALASFSAQIGQDSSGYASAVTLPNDEGIIVLLIWSSTRHFDACANFMLSFIDSLCIDYGSYFENGLVTEYAYPDTHTAQPIQLQIGGMDISSELQERDAEAAEALIEREYQVLLLYQKSPLWKEAWQRYYRMIFRDSFHRLQKCAFAIYNTLAPTCTDETDLAQKLLSWTQEFAYEREKTASDFASLPSILAGGGSDCDSRSMLLAVLLKQMNMDAMMFVSNEYSHAIAGITSSHPGHSFTVGEKNYLMGETTARGLTWGMISQDQDDQSKWIPVEFP